jgi:adenylate cyclase
MDTPVTRPAIPARWTITKTAFAPLLPQFFGSAFSIGYNLVIIIPLLGTQQLKARFEHTLIAYNAVIYPLAIWLWVRLVYSLRPSFQTLANGGTIPADELERVQRRVVNLPWWGALLSAIAWLGCIPVFLLSLATVGHALDPLLLWHFPISIVISTLIAVTHGIFFIEAISYRELFPVFFRDSRASLSTGRLALSLRWRGLLWAVSVGLCPIGSLLLLQFAPPAPGTDPKLFATLVGIAGTLFGIATALVMSSLIARPVDELQSAARDIAAGKLDRRITAARPDEFGQLLAAFDHMTDQLREKERVRQTFGLHVGRGAAEQILARDPRLGGVEQIITVMFVDIRGFTARSANAPAPAVVSELNEFLRVMVHVVEERNGGMINKFLGDGFMALFGVDGADQHALAAFRAGTDMLARLTELNEQLRTSGREPFRIGIGVHTGPAVVGSIGSPQRLEFTAIGNTVNIAARVEQLTKDLRVSLLVTDATAHCLPRSERLRALEPMEIRGIDGLVTVYTAELDVMSKA